MVQFTVRILVTTSVFCCLWQSAVHAQIKPPGYERELKEMQEEMRSSVLDQDSVTVIDTIQIYDPETYVATTRVVKSKSSWRDYCKFQLGISDPDVLLNGEPLDIIDPKTYEKIAVQWNASASKIDTIH